MTRSRFSYIDLCLNFWHFLVQGSYILFVYRMEFDKTRWSCSWNSVISDQNQVRIQDLVKGGAPGAEAESCRHSEAESLEWSEQFAAGGPGPT